MGVQYSAGGSRECSILQGFTGVQCLSIVQVIAKVSRVVLWVAMIAINLQ
jgi:hypothetical protein